MSYPCTVCKQVLVAKGGQICIECSNNGAIPFGFGCDIPGYENPDTTVNYDNADPTALLEDTLNRAIAFCRAQWMALEGTAKALDKTGKPIVGSYSRELTIEAGRLQKATTALVKDQVILLKAAHEAGKSLTFEEKLEVFVEFFLNAPKSHQKRLLQRLQKVFDESEGG